VRARTEVKERRETRRIGVKRERQRRDREKELKRESEAKMERVTKKEERWRATVRKGTDGVTESREKQRD
jgi:hypothetical protein